ncbi:MAG: sulfite exporter TauE/SafE family protein [Flavobacteriales bacterium]|nr:sulfite exporter TauE/SafE family protein [Flavobacteriales bacterium]
MDTTVFCLLLLVLSFLYSSVGHGGASGYIALMVIFGFNTSLIKVNALLLNIIVSSIAFYNFYNKKQFNYKLIGYLLIASIPMAFLGGTLTIESKLYKVLLGIVLLFPVARLFNIFPYRINMKIMPTIPILLLTGGIIGFASGLLGIGGGIILSPIILLLGWADIKETAAMSALFIFLNSIFGLIGQSTNGIEIHQEIILFAGIVICGGFIGSYWASNVKNKYVLKRVLASVLLIACYKLFFS